MNLNLYAYLLPDDENGFISFLGDNEICHKKIVMAIESTGKSSVRFPLFEDPRSNENWMRDHNTMHQSEGAALGFMVPELSQYDLKDPQQFAEWMLIHSALHSAENKILGIV